MVEAKKGVKKTGTGYYASSGDGLKKRKGKNASSFAGVVLHETCVESERCDKVWGKSSSAKYLNTYFYGTFRISSNSEIIYANFLFIYLVFRLMCSLAPVSALWFALLWMEEKNGRIH